ncbi:alpha/beta fold hydrolase [Alteribacillus iranensis]|uniref:Pimeloyl-ACP methyl ester carboxylesterase n=1 Tax=Alteribacillus iranensis TaxID=930128 RepID=A0A1I2F237_9BACI|nr:alpha/beta hydrolase [Alteribacillus iranensis]SFE99053.1 Pimeloyl-ACP methyl ester carboxylesterase [Alteribacillus iranensis]
MAKVRVKDVDIHYVMEGEGPPLILLHGMGNNARSWVHQFEELKKHYTVIAWDAPGYGNSSDPDYLLKDFSDFSAYLNGMVEKLQLNNIYLLGHSMGAAIAVDFATRYPEKVERLILAATTRGAAALTPDDNLKKHQGRCELVDTTSPEEIARTRVPALLSPHASESVRKYAEDIMAEIRPMGYKSVSHGLYNLNQMDAYPEISMPTLIICGKDDRVTPVSESEIIHQLIKNSRLQLLNDAGHLCYLEQPTIFNELVKQFLNE